MGSETNFRTSINGVRDEFPHMGTWICAGSVRKFVSDPIYPLTPFFRVSDPTYSGAKGIGQ
jgi:hypothetical protein